MEIYLTKIVLNPHSRRVHFEIGNPQELHKTVSGGFPKIENQESLPKHLRETPRNKFNVLHRLDINRRRERAILLVQSTVKPDWSNLRENFAEEVSCKTVHDKYSAIENGMRLMFRLQANPTKRIGKSDVAAKPKFKEYEKGKIRRRVELRTDEEKIEWLKRKGTGAGFCLASVRLKSDVENAASVAQSKIKGWRVGSDNPMTFGSVVFEGILQVTNAEKFREALQKGIGSGKAYGFGLLSIAPVKET